MKISGFAQLRNELEKDNLLNWFRCMDAVCDNIFIYDQNSTDGSLEEYKRHPNVHVIESPVNDFANEIRCKANLLDFLLEKSPDTKWIFWMDGDTLLERKALEQGAIQKLCQDNWNEDLDSLVFGHYNLWRSDIFYRIDSDYHFLHKRGVYALWKNKGNLSYQQASGFHKRQMPVGFDRCKRSQFSLIHRGFSRDDHIVERYLNYKEKGMSGPALERLIDERKLTVTQLPRNLLPQWFEVRDDTNPKQKSKIVDLFAGKLGKR
jgi:hypothetical protein